MVQAGWVKAPKLSSKSPLRSLRHSSSVWRRTQSKTLRPPRYHGHKRGTAAAPLIRTGYRTCRPPAPPPGSSGIPSPRSYLFARLSQGTSCSALRIIGDDRSEEFPSLYGITDHLELFVDAVVRGTSRDGCAW